MHQLQTANSKLTEDQKAILERVGEKLLVEGEAGSGKSTILSHWLIKFYDPNGAELVLISNTLEHALLLKEQLKHCYGNEVAAKIATNTFQGFCLNLILLHRPSIRLIYDDSNRHEALTILFPSDAENKTQEFHKHLQEEKLETLPWLNQYQALLHQQDAIDKQLLISEAIALVNSKTAAAHIKTKIGALAIDQAQELPAGALAILKPLVPQFPIGMAHNAAQQTSTLHQKKGVCHWFKSNFAKNTITLKQQFRLSPQQFALSQYLKSTKSHTIDPVATRGNRPKYFSFATPEHEAQILVQQIATFVKNHNDANNLVFGEFAILFRSNDAVSHLIEAFNHFKIPYILQTDTNLWLHEPYSHILAMLKLRTMPNDRVLQQQVLQHLFHCTLSDVRFLFAYMDRRRLTLLSPEIRTKTFSKSLTSAIDRLNHFCSIAVDNLPDLLQFGFDLLPNTKLHLPAPLLELTLTHFINYAVFAQYTDFCAFTQQAVRLVPFSQCSSLAVTHSYCVGIEDGITPYWAKGSSIAQERRLLYLAATRANNVHFTRSLKRIRNGKHEAKQPSRFLNAVPQKTLDRKQIKQGGKKNANEDQLSLF